MSRAAAAATAEAGEAAEEAEAEAVEEEDEGAAWGMISETAEISTHRAR